MVRKWRAFRLIRFIIRGWIDSRKWIWERDWSWIGLRRKFLRRRRIWTFWVLIRIYSRNSKASNSSLRMYRGVILSLISLLLQVEKSNRAIRTKMIIWICWIWMLIYWIISRIKSLWKMTFFNFYNNFSKFKIYKILIKIHLNLCLWLDLFWSSKT